MKKLKIGVVGVGRGSSMMKYCKIANNAELVAICDKWVEGLEEKKKEWGDSVAYYERYDDFLNHDMDVVILANYANEHAPFAIKAMEKGFHVISEVLPCQTMKEAVELIETVERTGKIYCYAENYCYMPAPREMRKLYREGLIGEFTYGEGEYVHDCEPIWPDITYGEEGHWRNNMYATFYCTHSIGPLVHITGLRPVSVMGIELPFNGKQARMGAKTGSAGIEMLTMENGAVVKSIHGGLNENSIWYSVYGSLGRMESARESVKDAHGVQTIYLDYNTVPGKYDDSTRTSYKPAEANESEEVAKAFGHGGSDYYTMLNCMNKILGDETADTIDVYEALDMFLPGMFAYRSVLAGGVRMEIPNLRNKEERDAWRNDTTCTDPKVAGDMLIPSYSKGTPVVDAGVYRNIRQIWLKKQEEKNKK